MKVVIERLSKIEHGFNHVQLEASNIFNTKSAEEIHPLAKELLGNDIYQARMLAVFLLGYLSVSESKALNVLRNVVSKDDNWRVQEILAKSFDYYCSKTGYEKSLPVINEWLSDSIPNVCRAVTEGLRIWTTRPFFDKNPKIAIQLISQHKSSESEYLRKSVGNSLRDIYKKHKYLVEKEISGWDMDNNRIKFTYNLIVK